MQRVHTPAGWISRVPPRSSAPLLVAIASLLIACDSPVTGSNGAPCSTGPSPAVLSWNPVSDPNVAGYRVYYGTAPGAYLQPIGAGLDAAAATTFTATNLTSGTIYYFAVTAYDASIAAKESSFSNEVCKAIPP